MLGERKRSAAVERQVRVFRYEGSAYPCLHCFDGGEDVAFQSRYEHGLDGNRNTLASLVDDIPPEGACCCWEYLLVPLVLMAFGSFSIVKSLMLFRSLGISSSFIKWSDAPLSTIIVNLSLLG